MPSNNWEEMVQSLSLTWSQLWKFLGTKEQFTSEKSSNPKALTWSTNLGVGGWNMPSLRSVLQVLQVSIVALQLSSVVVMSSHLITNRMRFYFFQSKCVVIVYSACHFPTRGGMQCNSVKRSLRFARSKFENFMGYPCFMSYPWCLLERFGLVKE